MCVPSLVDCLLDVGKECAYSLTGRLLVDSVFVFSLPQPM